LRQKTLKMTGLTCTGCTCGHCGQPILFFLSCQLGINKVEPHFEEQTVTIEYDETIMTFEELIQAIKVRGYAVELM
jgi:copper chaperone CopZ